MEGIEVYQGLQTVAGGRTISEFIEELARPIVRVHYTGYLRKVTAARHQ